MVGGLRDLTPGEAITVRRGDVVVCIPLHGAHDHFARCLASILEHTPEDVTVLVADDAGPDPASYAFAQRLAEGGVLRHDLVWLRQPRNLGYVGNCNAVFAATAPADVVLLNSDCEVAAGWLEGLRDAALSDATIATATALSNHATLLSVPHRNLPLPQLPVHLDFPNAAARVRATSLRLRPRLPTAIGHCLYLRRAALELAGGFDEAFAPAYGEEVDFSQRCLLRGLQHVAADDVFVLHRGAASLGDAGALQEHHERLIEERYPYYPETIRVAERDQTSPLARSLAVARQAFLDPTVTVDGRCLNASMTGVQVHTMELVAALWRTGDVRLRVILPHDPGPLAQEILDGLNGVEVVALERFGDEPEPSDIVHRPYQLSAAGDLDVLARAGRRVVITQQDLIGYHNPGYFPDGADLSLFRRLTRYALSFADLVLFPSQHAADDAVGADLVDADRARVVYNGVDHALARRHPEPREPPAARPLRGAPYLLCLGTDFHHKNRVFALRLMGALADRGWDGRLVLAGPRVAHGSSSGDEAQWLALHPDTARRVITLAAVDEAEKSWLYAHAVAVVYPSTYEGFGLVPFEAAAAGVPCLWAPQGSLPEVLGDIEATLVPWDAEASADRCLALLGDARLRAAQVAAVRERARAFTWDRAARAVVEAYRELVGLPARPVGRLVAGIRAAEAQRADCETRHRALQEAVGGAGRAIAGPDAWLPDEAQRALAGLARRRVTRGVLIGALRALHRAGGITRDRTS